MRGLLRCKLVFTYSCCCFCVTIFLIGDGITNEGEQQGRNDDESDQLRNQKNVWIFFLNIRLI